MARTASKQINFRVTDEELSILELNAERAGLKIPALCKNAALSLKVRPQVIDKEIGKLILPHLSHIGSNINQLAKKANEGGTVAAVELAEVKAEFEKMWDYVLSGKKPQTDEQTGMEKNKQEQSKVEVSSSFSSPSASAVERTCSKCGAVLKLKHSDKKGKNYWICPNYSQEEKGHTFEWVEG